MNHKRTRLKDIAETLHVSITTVNRALKNHPDISTKLKEQILFLAEELHYRPNFFASSLRNRRSGIIGVILPKVIHYFSSTVLSGIIKTSGDHCYQVLISESNNELEREKLSLMNMINSGVDGVLIAVSNNTKDETHLMILEQEEIPFVFFDKVPDFVNGPKVLTNDRKGAFMATEHLIKQGYKRIAHIKGQQASRNALPRYKGYREALDKYGYDIDESLMKECTVATEEEGYDLAIQLLKLKNKPDAFFCVNDETAIGVLTALRKQKLKVPDQIGVVGFSNIKTSAYLQPTLTSIEQFGFDIGKTATEILLDLIANNTKVITTEYQNAVLDPKLIIRESSKRT
ncbi:MAG: LacI family DNA-binding transcriptional regulator [Flavisolibacter sp.]|nr:LacI family DNA-binding transcriptional regulator [Flavisolibacter sp.]